MHVLALIFEKDSTLAPYSVHAGKILQKHCEFNSGRKTRLTRKFLKYTILTNDPKIKIDGPSRRDVEKGVEIGSEVFWRHLF